MRFEAVERFRRFFLAEEMTMRELDSGELVDGLTVVRSLRRRRVAFTVRPEDGAPVILVPPRLSVAEIRRIVERNGGLLEKLRARFLEYDARRTVPRFCEGDEFHYLGRLYPLRFSRRILAFDDAFLVPSGDGEAVRLCLETLYRRLATELLTEKVAAFAERFGLTCSRVRIGGAGRRWGSCSRNGNINFSWRLVRWPEPVVDYVVIHELAHRIELNHSERFWREVGRMCPDFKEYDHFLRDRIPEYCPW